MTAGGPEGQTCGREEDVGVVKGRQESYAMECFVSLTVAMDTRTYTRDKMT